MERHIKNKDEYKPIGRRSDNSQKIYLKCVNGKGDYKWYNLEKEEFVNQNPFAKSPMTIGWPKTKEEIMRKFFHEKLNKFPEYLWILTFEEAKCLFNHRHTLWITISNINQYLFFMFSVINDPQFWGKTNITDFIGTLYYYFPRFKKVEGVGIGDIKQWEEEEGKKKEKVTITYTNNTTELVESDGWETIENIVIHIAINYGFSKYDNINTTVIGNYGDDDDDPHEKYNDHIEDEVINYLPFLKEEKEEEEMKGKIIILTKKIPLDINYNPLPIKYDKYWNRIDEIENENTKWIISEFIKIDIIKDVRKIFMDNDIQKLFDNIYDEDIRMYLHMLNEEEAIKKLIKLKKLKKRQGEKYDGIFLLSIVNIDVIFPFTEMKEKTICGTLYSYNFARVPKLEKINFYIITWDKKTFFSVYHYNKKKFIMENIQNVKSIYEEIKKINKWTDIFRIRNEYPLEWTPEIYLKYIESIKIGEAKWYIYPIMRQLKIIFGDIKEYVFNMVYNMDIKKYIWAVNKSEVKSIIEKVKYSSNMVYCLISVIIKDPNLVDPEYLCCGTVYFFLLEEKKIIIKTPYLIRWEKKQGFCSYIYGNKKARFLICESKPFDDLLFVISDIASIEKFKNVTVLTITDVSRKEKYPWLYTQKIDLSKEEKEKYSNFFEKI